MTACSHDTLLAPSWASGYGEITWQCGLCEAEATVRIDMDSVRWNVPEGATCRHCERRIVNMDGIWVDPEATGDDSVWRESCDSHDTFTAEHEPTD